MPFWKKGKAEKGKYVRKRKKDERKRGSRM
jgi:hypothetical protein